MSGHPGLLDAARIATLVLLLVAIWAFTHVYKGITGDAELYAMQAFSRLHHGLATDLYLQNTSQDRFTVFSPFYAWFIARMGLPLAALILSLVASLTFFFAGGVLVRQLSTRAAAFLAVAALIVIKGSYGAYGVFGYAENWLTARSVAEALVVVAIAGSISERWNLALLMSSLAMAFHPIMALPGFMLVLCLWLPLRISAFAALLGIVGTLVLATVASHVAATTGPLTVMDPAWLDVVRERSQFLFPQYWTLQDWSLNIRPLLYLATYSFMLDGKARKLCLTALIVGSSGLAVAAIAGLIGPVALLLQGQAWRWIWVAAFSSVLLLAPVVMRVWQEEARTCGRLCALLLVLGWTFPLINPIVCVSAALLIWAFRFRLPEDLPRYLTLTAGAIAIIVLSWTFATGWSLLNASSAESGRDPWVVAHLRDILGLGTSAVLLVGLSIIVILRIRSIRILGALSATFLAGSAFALPGSLANERNTAGNPGAFTDWRSVIPPTSVVYLLPAHNSAAFAWFTLERASYLTLDQSAGVVFSRATALEVRRRSDILLPIEDPDWQILTKIRNKSKRGYESPPRRSLTAVILTKICRDPVLGFVVAKEKLDFAPVPHEGVGEWMNWNLYDCQRVRSASINR